MNAARTQPGPPPRARPDPAAIRFQLVLPVTRLEIGGVGFDPLEQFLGKPVRQILASLLTAEPFRRPSPSGPAVEVYPLHLPPGEGAFIPLAPWGELGFHNDRGLLRLTVPLQTSPWLQGRFGAALVRGPEPTLSTDRTAMVAHAWIRLQPGMRAAWPLGSFGELGIEAA